MGKDWLFWGTGGGGKSTKKPARLVGGGGGGAAPAAVKETAEAASPTGCMCAVLQLFDLHQFQISLHHQSSFRQARSFMHDEPCTAIKGIEAPRNSLEMEDEALMQSDSSSSSTRGKEQEDLNIPVSIQIKTTRENISPRASFSKAITRSRTTTMADDLFSDSCSSDSPAGGNKTPTLVARLMGLDQLPPQVQTPSAAASAFNSQAHSSHMHHRHQLRGLHQLRQSGSHQVLSHKRSCSHRSFFDNDITAGSGTLSLPETPRMSSARRSDVDHGHRLSLQINKENIAEELETSSYSSAAAAAAVKNLQARKRRQLVNKQADDQEHRRSGSDYAKEIVKQMKENVSRKVGLDITNTIKSTRDQKFRTDHDHVILLHPKKPSTQVHGTKVAHESAPNKQSTSSCSPRLSDHINKPLSTAKNQTNSHSPRPLSPSPENQQSQQGNKVHSTSAPQLLKLREEQQSSAAPKKCKKDGHEKYSSRVRRTCSKVPDPILKKKEEPFIRPTTAPKGNNVTDKMCKKTPISTDIFNISVPTLLPVKKQSQASSDGDLRKSSAQTSSCSRQAYKPKQQQLQVTHKLKLQDNIQDTCHRTTTTSNPISSGDQVVELEYRYYIQRILKRAAIDKATPVSLAKWYNPSHPLDPSIFHYIELFHPTVTYTPPSPGAKASDLSLRCNRKLVFQVVDELLADILKQYLGVSRLRCRRPRDQMYGSELMDTLCSRIKKFPRAECKVLEDIDALIGTDMGKAADADCEEEEKEGIVEEIQREIVKSLVHDTAMAII